MITKNARCKQCREKKSINKLMRVPVGVFCNSKCIKAYALETKNQSKLVSIGKKEVDKFFTAKKRTHKLNDKTLRRRKADEFFNRFIRLRDDKEPCISCQRHHAGQYHAGHYQPKGMNSALRYNELNVHKQCAPCNNHKSGNLTEYRINLINKIGLEAVEDLEQNRVPTQYNCEQLKQIEDAYKEKCKELTEELAA